MIPDRIQGAHMGALSADKNFQSIKHNPHNAQRVFEEEIKKQLDDAKYRTEAAEKSEKGSIKDKEQSNQQHNQEESDQEESKKQQLTENKQEHGPNYIEKSENGRIKHLDIKI